MLIDIKRVTRGGLATLVAINGDALPDVQDVQLFKPEKREEYANRLASAHGIADTSEILAILVNIAAQAADEVKQKNEAKPQKSASFTSSDRDKLLAEKDQENERLLRDTDAEILREANEFLRNPKMVNTIIADAEAMGVVREPILSVQQYANATSRLLDKPNNAILTAPSSSGKSFTIERMSALVPPEAKLLATDMTPNALYYLEPGRLMHCYVVGGERSRVEDDERAEATRALREMMSGGELNKVVPVKEDGKQITKIIWQPGPIAFIESTTLTDIFDEDANRCLLLATDESAAQTKAIIASAAERAASDNETQLDGIIAKHHAAQRMLRRVKVLVSFASRIGDAMPSEKPQARRAFGQIISMIRAVALLHQRQRADGPLSHGDTIEATIADYAIARRLLLGPLGRALGGSLSPSVANFGDRLAKRHGSDTFTTADASRGDEIIQSRKASEYLRALANAGVVECVEAHKGTKPATWKVIAETPAAGAIWLPEPGAIQ